MEDILKDLSNYIKLKDYSSAYLNPCKLFLKYCTEKQLDYKNLSFSQLSDFILSVKENKSNPYVNLFIDSLNFFYNFLDDNNIEYNKQTFIELKKIRRLRIDKKIKDRVSLVDLDKALLLFNSYGFSFDPLKAKAIAYFIYYTGVRRGELLNLSRDNINLKELTAIIRVPNKTRTEREVYFPVKVRDLLKVYFNHDPEIINAFNVSDSQLKIFFIRLKNFNPKIRAHSLRHSFTEMLASKGIDIRVAQQLLGHSNISTTLIYYNPSNETCKNIYRKKIK